MEVNVLNAILDVQVVQEAAVIVIHVPLDIIMIIISAKFVIQNVKYAHQLLVVPCVQLVIISQEILVFNVVMELILIVEAAVHVILTV